MAKKIGTDNRRPSRVLMYFYLFFLVMSFVDSPSKKFFISVTPFHFNACPFDTFLRDFFFTPLLA